MHFSSYNKVTPIELKSQIDAIIDSISEKSTEEPREKGLATTKNT